MSSENARAIDAILSKKDTDIIESHLTIGSREARIRFGKIVENAKNDENQFVITEHGEPAAALIPISDLRILDWIKRQNMTNRIRNAAFKDMSWGDLLQSLEGGTDELRPTELLGKVVIKNPNVA